jgi:hypothetical protein
MSPDRMPIGIVFGRAGVEEALLDRENQCAYSRPVVQLKSAACVI